jgi:hypothetical protein
MGASAKLASAEGVNAAPNWQELNELKRFVCAFPMPALNLG